MMKILHCVHAYVPHFGGCESVMSEMSERLVTRGHDVTVATSFMEERKKKAINGVKVEEFKPDLSSEKQRYKTFVTKDDWDIIMVYHSKVWTSYWLYPLKGMKAPVLYFPVELTDLGSMHPKYLSYYSMIEPKFLRNATRVGVLTSSDQKGYIPSKLKGREEKIKLIPNGIDYNYFQKDPGVNIRKRWNIKEENLVYYVGGYFDKKQVDILIKAVKGLDDFALVTVGNDAGTYEQCKELAAGSSNIHLLGKINHKELVSAYHACDVYANACNLEGFGVAVLEAMACGKPVVTLATGAFPDFFAKGTVGTLIDIDSASPDKFKEAFLQAVKSENIEKAKRKNREVARQYDWEAIVDILENNYMEMIKVHEG